MSSPISYERGLIFVLNTYVLLSAILPTALSFNTIMPSPHTWRQLDCDSWHSLILGSDVSQNQADTGGDHFHKEARVTPNILYAISWFTTFQYISS